MGGSCTLCDDCPTSGGAPRSSSQAPTQLGFSCAMAVSISCASMGVIFRFYRYRWPVPLNNTTSMSQSCLCVMQAFASPARLSEMVTRVKTAMAGPMPAAVAKMRLYMANPGTHKVLLKV